MLVVVILTTGSGQQMHWLHKHPIRYVHALVLNSNTIYCSIIVTNRTASTKFLYEVNLNVKTSSW
jgi:hypothetical protein